MPSAPTVKIVQSIAEIDAAQWDACANPALPTDGLAVAADGAIVLHCLPAHRGKVVAAAPCYIKTHSMGEYVFDHAWADAYHRAGIDYYPKLQVCVPFTPVTGRRLLVAADAPPNARETLLAGLEAWCRKIEASSVHATFPAREDDAAMGATSKMASSASISTGLKAA